MAGFWKRASLIGVVNVESKSKKTARLAESAGHIGFGEFAGLWAGLGAGLGAKLGAGLGVAVLPLLA